MIPLPHGVVGNLAYRITFLMRAINKTKPPVVIARVEQAQSIDIHWVKVYKSAAVRRTGFTDDRPHTESGLKKSDNEWLSTGIQSQAIG